MADDENYANPLSDGLTPQSENSMGPLYVNLTPWEPEDARDIAAPPPDPYPTLRFLVLRLNHYLIPVIILLGIVGNLFSLMVFLGTYMRRRSVSVYLAALAISDTSFLVTLTVTWLEYVHINVFHTNGWCQLVIYLSYCSSFLSVWFVVSFTVERYIAVCHPLKRPEMCTTERARHVVVWLTVACLVAYSVTLWTSGIVEIYGVKGDSYYICTPLSKFMAVHTALTYADTVATLLVPFLTIVVLNIKIAHRIAYFYNRHKQRCTVIQSINRESHLTSSTGSSRMPFATNMSSSASQGVVHTEARVSFTLCSKAQLQITKMLLIISSLFLLVNLPSYVLRLRLFILSVLQHQLDVKAQNFQILLQQIFQLVYYTNFGMNFVLYSICSSKFRQAFARFWKQMRRRVLTICEYSSCCDNNREHGDYMYGPDSCCVVPQCCFGCSRCYGDEYLDVRPNHPSPKYRGQHKHVQPTVACRDQR